MQQKSPDTDTDKRRAALQHAELAAALKDDDSTLLAYTDGSLIDDTAGAGALVVHGGRTVYSLARGLGALGDVYDGELLALVAGAKAAVRIAGRVGTNITHIRFFADNDAAIGRAASLAPVSGQFLSILFADAVSPFLQQGANRVTLSWVPGHEGVRGNEAADLLAKGGGVAATLPPVKVTRTRARRDSSVRLLDNWRASWLASARRGSFAPADRFPPSNRPTTRLRTLDKPMFVPPSIAAPGMLFSTGALLHLAPRA